MMNIKLIRNNLYSKIGSRMVIVYYGSRNRKERYEGVLDKIYYNIFTLKLIDGKTKSFSYSDVLTKTIQIYV